ncbi:hypothetical protein [Bacillus cereus group sp. BfR-BA-01349]|uniref:hypothetical protein n=1 Tax=Bacillus cereus group sp. BfR-BA-01349 TaxID=2920312 RepID=UPI001F55B278
MVTVLFLGKEESTVLSIFLACYIFVFGILEQSLEVLLVHKKYVDAYYIHPNTPVVFSNPHIFYYL